MTTTDATPRPQTVHVTPDEVAEWLRTGEAVLVDVREPVEHHQERIDGATPAPLASLDPGALSAAAEGRPLILHCRTGSRAASAATKFRGHDQPVYQLAGGIEAWKARGLPVTRSARAPRLDLMRQVHCVAGTLVLVGAVLGAVVHPGFIALSGFVGAGLLFAGLSGWCGMAKLLSRMPWNRVDTD